MSEHLPEPPEALDELQPVDIRVLSAGTRLIRLFFAGGPHPSRWNSVRHYGPTRSRFDHHPPPPKLHDDVAISYWAVDGSQTPVPSNPLATALAEVFAENRTVDLTTDAPSMVVAPTRRKLRLLDVSDSAWVTRNHGNAAISSGHRQASRHWAQIIHSTYPHLDGIWYQSSTYPPGRCLALNERALDAYADHPDFSGALSDSRIVDMIRAAAYEVGYRIQ